MTIECSIFVLIPEDLSTRVLDLNGLALAALRRSWKLMPGDRSEALRFESIHAVIDQLAIASMANGEPSVLSPYRLSTSVSGTSVLSGDTPDRSQLPGEVVQWLGAGRVAVELRLPHGMGETPIETEVGYGPRPPLQRWRSGTTDPKLATRERFEFLLSSALEDSGADQGAVKPSDVPNTVLTETLRKYSEAKDGKSRADIRVTYRDGSDGPPFPFRALRMMDSQPKDWRVLRFTLMSIRHVEMDDIVDGAWLRNSKISRPRPAGLTDRIVFEISLRQLKRISGRPTLVRMYQTGLEPAIVGFYRAVVCHMLENPSSIAVVPHYYQGRNGFVEGTTWRAM